MSIFDKIYGYIMNINVGTHKGDDFNPEKIHCYVDGKEVDCFIDRLETEGYRYDSGNDWWERTWSTNNGKESIREVYQQLESGNWKQLMIGYGDNIFYEESVKVRDGVLSNQ
mgnify:FL=1|jgi:hypothetical protein|tara:strand:+ start:547 stop:882 length:336 start_codon:yes stop_codon:yes gene_type:complete